MPFLKTTTADHVLHVTLARPEAHNALNSELIAELTAVFKSAAKNKDLRAAVLRGEGPSFCAGGDLNWMRKSIKYTLAQNKKDAQKLSDMYEAIFQCPVPVLGVAHGSVMGGGVGLTAVCDIVAAESETKFCLSEVRLGLVPSIISPYVLRKVSESSARPLMLTAEVFKASHAVDIGLVHFAGTHEQANEFIIGKLNLILNNGPEATRVTKGLIHKVKTSSWDQARNAAVKTIAERRVSKEGQEGMNAFFEKREASWKKKL
jgi:methylglutaconyl-CoA hydratase